MTNTKKLSYLFVAFFNPLLVLSGILVYLFLHLARQESIATVVIYGAVLLGTFQMLKETVQSIVRRQLALDYIAILAIVIALITREYLVAGILALMISTGSTLDNYAVSAAKKSLTNLIDRIPTDITLWKNDKPGEKVALSSVKVGDEVFIRKGEVIGLDGTLVSDVAETDESSLTGEPYFITKIKGDSIRSGTVNIGQPMVIIVEKLEKDSTYKKIVTMVQEAEEEKSPLVRLADKYSVLFTFVTLGIGVFSYFYSGFDLSRVLAVLAVATPCPLIIATPIALLGGMNASAKRKIIIKKLAALEVLSRVQTIVFDKTGTITLGKPIVTKVEIVDKNYSEIDIFSIAHAIERNSLHPLAKAIIEASKLKKIVVHTVHDIQEIIGTGISGTVDGKKYVLSKIEGSVGMTIALIYKDKQIALFSFEDEIKQESKKTIADLTKIGLELQIFTGDKKEATLKIIKQLGTQVLVKADCTPKDKQEGIKALKLEGKITAMVGDGINDAPALALADVGMAFSNQEQTAASEAADIVFLGGDFSMVLESWQIARRTIAIAKQSILWGIGLSIGAMVFASVGLITPIFGAGLQEAIDVAVIINALRASR